MNIDFEGAQVIGKPASMTDDQCAAAYAMPFVQEVDVEGTAEKVKVQCWLMCYQPSVEDMAAIAAGQPIALKIMAPLLPPHAIWTHNAVTGEPNF